MKRRDFLKTITTGVALATVSAGSVQDVHALTFSSRLRFSSPKFPSHDLESYLKKVRQFDEDHFGDIYLNSKQYRTLSRLVKRLNRLQKLIGFGNFFLLDFDDAIKYARLHKSVGLFTSSELDFLEMIFYSRASDYGFYGEKPLKNLTDRIPRRKVVKIRNTGNYLYKGRPLETHHKIKKELGDELELTSGVRSVTKQIKLFLNKVHKSNGNLSRASRSLAPPGYSFHGISDFDVGQMGYGQFNFTEKFVTSHVFKRLKSLGYLTLRYPSDNMLGVRFEPWHIKVNNRA